MEDKQSLQEACYHVANKAIEEMDGKTRQIFESFYNEADESMLRAFLALGTLNPDRRIGDVHKEIKTAYICIREQRLGKQ